MTVAVERFELRGALSNLQEGDVVDTRTLELIDEADRHVALLQELAEAHSDLRNWLLARPAQTPSSKAQLAVLAARLEKIRDRLSAHQAGAAPAETSDDP